MTAMLLLLLLLRMTATSDVVVVRRTVGTIPKLFHAECGSLLPQPHTTTPYAPVIGVPPTGRHCVHWSVCHYFWILEQNVVFTFSPIDS
uniref:Putative secreted peptide n=1 Tax=Anopheles braziliensis TaxID=58242 RepID=A0A2M3ZTG6_9DIPT